jgi:glycosyltransferase involved in cell wall biosynthesis
MAKVSIITINLNNAAGLRRTIESVIGQSYKNYELLIIDGGSTDESVAVMEKYANACSFLVSEKDKGIYFAQNKGIYHATGEYVFFLNSGDEFYNADVLEQVFSAPKSAAVDIIYGDIRLAKGGSQIRTKTYPVKLSHYYLLTDNVAHQSQFIRRQLFADFGDYDTSYKIVADYELFVRFVYKHHISTEHMAVIISIYNLDGISAEKEHVQRILAERKRVQQLYMPSILVWMYQAYADFLQSRLYKNRLVSQITNGIRDVIFFFIKPRTH